MMRRLLFLVIWSGVAVALPYAQDNIAAIEAAGRTAEDAGRLDEAFDAYLRAVRALPPVNPADDEAARRARLESDVRLRERLVTLASKIPARPIPTEAELAATGGRTEFAEAKNDDGFDRAEAQFRKAVELAPWAPAFAYNLALVQEKLDMLRSAAGNLRVYLASAPADAHEAKAKMLQLQYRVERGSEHYSVWFDVTVNQKRTGTHGYFQTHDQAFWPKPALWLNHSTGEVWNAGQWRAVPNHKLIRHRIADDKLLDGLAKTFGDAQRKTRKKVATRTIAGMLCDEYEIVSKAAIQRLCVTSALKPPPLFLEVADDVYRSEPWDGWSRFALALWREVRQLAPTGGFPLAFSSQLKRPVPKPDEFPQQMSWTASRVEKAYLAIRSRPNGVVYAVQNR